MTTPDLTLRIFQSAKNRGLSLRELARRIKVTCSTLARARQKLDLSPALTRAVCHELDVIPIVLGGEFAGHKRNSDAAYLTIVHRLLHADPLSRKHFINLLLIAEDDHQRRLPISPSQPTMPSIGIFMEDTMPAPNKKLSHQLRILSEH